MSVIYYLIAESYFPHERHKLFQCSENNVVNLFYLSIKKYEQSIGNIAQKQFSNIMYTWLWYLIVLINHG